jgi:hypothetical protein
VLALASGRENRLVHISSDSVMAVKEKMTVFVLQTKLRFLYWKFNIVRDDINPSVHPLCRITPISVSSLLRSIRQEESSPK